MDIKLSLTLFISFSIGIYLGYLKGRQEGWHEGYDCCSEALEQFFLDRIRRERIRSESLLDDESLN